MLYLVGMGFGNDGDITLRGLEAVKLCDKVFVQSLLFLVSQDLSQNGLSKLENLFGKPVILVDGELSKEKANEILSSANSSHVALLVPGDPSGATNHREVIVEARKQGIKVKVVHNVSLMTSTGICGLQLYRYGQIVDIPFFTETSKPDHFYHKIQQNRSLGLHTLCVLDICEKESPRYMTINAAIQQLLEVEKAKGESAYDEETQCVGIARIGSEDQIIVAGSMKELVSVDFGNPLHCLVIVSQTHPLEEEMLEFYRVA